MRCALAILLLTASPAHAGRTLYGWLIETDTMSTQAELGTAIYEHTNLGPLHERATALVWTPAIAVTDNVEVAIPIEVATRTADDIPASGGVTRYGAELRYALAELAGVQPLARFALSRNVAIQTQVRSEAELAASYTRGTVQLELDAGFVLDVNIGSIHMELRPGAGASVRVTGELRLGAELYANLSRDATTPSWASLGPTLAWARGPFWVAGVLGIGIDHITAAPRLNMAMQW